MSTVFRATADEDEDEEVCEYCGEAGYLDEDMECYSPACLGRRCDAAMDYFEEMR